MAGVLYVVIGVLLVSWFIIAKIAFDKSKAAEDVSRQLNELRAVYQKMEYSVTTSEKRINDLNAENKSLHDELDVLVAANPLANAAKINNRIKK